MNRTEYEKVIGDQLITFLRITISNTRDNQVSINLGLIVSALEGKNIEVHRRFVKFWWDCFDQLCQKGFDPAHLQSPEQMEKDEEKFMPILATLMRPELFRLISLSKSYIYSPEEADQIISYSTIIP